MKLVIQIVLWAVIVFLAYMLYNSISGPLKFNEIKEARYIKVINGLKDIRAAELAHQEVTGTFTGNFDSLIKFIDTAQFAIIERRDTSYADVAKNRAFGLSEGYFIEEIIVDTLGYTPVKERLFQDSDHYKSMMKVPVEGIEANFELKAGTYEKNGTNYAVFESKISKDVLLADLDKDLLVQEKQVVSVDGVNGEYLKVGAMDDVNTSGNWPKIFDSAKEK